MKYALSENIKKLRMKKHLTQTQLAKRLGVGTSIISAYENQDRLPSGLRKKLCKQYLTTLDKAKITGISLI